MNFWERVEYLLDQKDITKKELAMTAGFCPSNISKGKREGSFPSAETAVAIADFLETTVEYLVTGNCTRISKSEEDKIDTLSHYIKTMKQLDSIPDSRRKIIETMIQDMGNLE